MGRLLGVPEMLRGDEPEDVPAAIPAEVLLGGERPLPEATEALIGACFVAFGFERAGRRSRRPSSRGSSTPAETRIDFKSALQELLARRGARVSYEVIAATGPPHRRTFEVAAIVDSERVGEGGAGEGGRAGRRRAGAEAARGLTGWPASRPTHPRALATQGQTTEGEMYLRSITMKGFKSFPERARLEFSPGVSVIVGPNGSGKSNITDAVLWALGEQSPGAIRGASMQDVISAGGKGVGQRRSAEVEVVIDNSDGRAATEFSEISVQRRLDRSGEGGYRLNGARCRLVDVVEVLSDTNLGREMHSVISQGRVETIVHSKPRERRLLVEEAAGLGKHRKRRRRAELKLRAARDNLDRALDVEREARARLRPLKRQAQAAELGARIEREELGLRGRLVSEELRFGADRAAAAEKAAEKARATRTGIEERLAEVSERRRAAEERFAARDRERTQAWGLLTKLRGEQERIAVRAAGLTGREAELEASLEALRAELGPLTLDVGAAGGAPAERARKLEEELGEIDAGLTAAAEGPSTARSADAAEAARETALGRSVQAAPSGRSATPAGPRACWASATARRCASGWPPARSCSTTCAPPPRRWRRSAPRSAPGSSGPRARWSAARATATRSPRRCGPARSASTSCRRR